MSEVISAHIHEDLELIKTELARIRDIIAEDYELSDKAKVALAKARKTPRSKYISHEDVKKQLLR